MKKAILLTFFGFVTAVIAVLIYALTSPSFQTAQINSLLDKFAAGAKVGNAKLSLGKAFVEDLKLPLADGTVVKLKSAETKFSVGDLFSKKIKLEASKVAGLEIDLTHRSGAKKLSVPDAKTNVAESGESDTAQKNAFDWEVSLEDLTFEIRALLQGGKSVSTRGNLRNLILESGLKIKSGTVNADVSASLPDGTNETFKILFATEKNGGGIGAKALLQKGDDKILQAEGIFAQDYKSGEFKVRLDANDKNLSSIISNLSAEFPSFSSSVYVEGKFENLAESMGGKLVFSNEISGAGKFYKPLEEFGKLGLSGEADFKKKGGLISVDKFDVSVSSNGINILNANAPRPFVFDIEKLSELPSGELADITLAFPAKKLSGFLPSGKEILCEDICTKLSVSRGDGSTLKIRTVSPLNLTGLSYFSDGEKFFENLNALAQISAVWSPRADSSAEISLEIVDTPEKKLTVSLSSVSSPDGKIGAKLKAGGFLSPLISRVCSASGASAPEMKSELSAKIEYSKNLLLLKSFKASFDLPDGKNILKITQKSDAGYDLAKGEARFSSPDIAEIEAESVPFALVKPFVACADAKSFSASAKLSSPRGDSSAFIVSGNAALQSLYIKNGGIISVRDLSLSTGIQAAWRAGEFGLKIVRARLADGNVDFAELDGEFAVNYLEKNVAGKSSGDILLPALLRQPALAKFDNAATGNLTYAAEIDYAANDGIKKMSAAAKIHNLTARGALSNRIGSFILNTELSGNAKCARVAATLFMQSTGGESNAEVRLQKDEKISLSLEAKKLVADDFMTLVSAFSGKTDEYVNPQAMQGKKYVRPKLDGSEKKSDSIAPKDTKAFWYFGMPVGASAKIASLEREGKVLLNDVSAVFSSTAEKIELSELKANLLGAPLSASFTAFFNPSLDVPYSLKNASAKLENFETSELSNNPKNAMIGGAYDISASFSGVGNNAEHLFGYLCGKFTAQNKNGGILRLVDRNSDLGAATGITGMALGISGAILGNKASELTPTAQIIPYLYEITYSSADIEIERVEKDYNFKILKAEIIGDKIAVNANGGKILFNPDAGFKDWQLQIPVTMFVSEGPLRVLLRKTGRAEESAKNLKGYFIGPVFEIGGTIGSPETDIAQILLGKKSTGAKKLLNFFKNL